MKGLKYFLATIATTAVFPLVSASPSHAAENMRITYGAVNRDIPIASFANFAETGQVDRQLRWYFDFLDESQVQGAQDALNFEISVNFSTFAKFLRSDLGNVVLSELSNVISPPSQNIDGVQALRAALVNASSDGSFTTVEFMEEYPNSRFLVDARLLAVLVQDAQDFVEDLRGAVDTFSEIEDPLGDIELLANSFLDEQKTDALVLKIASFIEQVGEITVSSGLTDIDLDSETPPEGDVVIPKAAIWELYQNLSSLGLDVDEFISDPFTEGDGVGD